LTAFPFRVGCVVAPPVSKVIAFKNHGLEIAMVTAKVALNQALKDSRHMLSSTDRGLPLTLTLGRRHQLAGAVLFAVPYFV
jgi:hypothetical protein